MAKQVVTSIRVDEGLWRRARIYALKKGITISELLNTLLRKELEDQKGE
jgi:antitoxin component of RelBE/YafQ-DinJ toxin-antitoxin module